MRKLLEPGGFRRKEDSAGLEPEFPSGLELEGAKQLRLIMTLKTRTKMNP